MESNKDMTPYSSLYVNEKFEKISKLTQTTLDKQTQIVELSLSVSLKDI